VTANAWITLAAGAALAVLAAVAGVWWWWRRAPEPERALRAIAVDRLSSVLVPNGMGGHIHVDSLLLTAKGLVVVDVKEVEGVVFGSDRMTDWTVIGARGRFSFPNPQGSLYDRVAAVRQLIRDVPVTGHVLFSPGADFSKGRPKDVMLPAELLERYAKPDRDEIERTMNAFALHWERLCDAVESAQKT
jgi:hypothetical protein